MSFFTELEQLPLIVKTCRECGTIYKSRDTKGTKFDIIPDDVCGECFTKLVEEEE